MKTEEYWSWTIVNDDVVIKHCDLTSHRYNVCKIVKPLRLYWDIQDGQPKDDWSVKMNYEGEQEEAQIEVLDSGQGRLRFSPKMREYLKKHNREEYEVIFTYTKVGPKEYNVEADAKFKDQEWEDILDSVVMVPEPGRPEGMKKMYYTTKYERIERYRRDAIKAHGCVCQVCGFDFEKVYGVRGRGFIEVHHKVPLHSRDELVVPDPEKDMACLCANCHRMIHRKRDVIINVDKLQEMIKDAGEK